MKQSKFLGSGPGLEFSTAFSTMAVVAHLKTSRPSMWMCGPVPLDLAPVVDLDDARCLGLRPPQRRPDGAARWRSDDDTSAVGRTRPSRRSVMSVYFDSVSTPAAARCRGACPDHGLGHAHAIEPGAGGGWSEAAEERRGRAARRGSEPVGGSTAEVGDGRPHDDRVDVGARCSPARSMALQAASTPGVSASSPSATQRRSVMPVRCSIHSGVGRSSCTSLRW